MARKAPSKNQSWEVSLGNVALYHPTRLQKHAEAFLALTHPTIEDLGPFHMHYYGADAIREMAATLELDNSHTVLDLGAGFCATSCILAKEYGCHVTAVELQSHLADFGRKCVEKLGLQDSVAVIENNIFELDLPKKVDAVIALFSVIHIGDRIKLFSTVRHMLKPNGTFYIQDFYRSRDPTPEEEELLKKVVGVSLLPNKKQFEDQLIEAGFERLSFKDVSPEWKEFVKRRASAQPLGAEHREIAIFNDTVNALFQMECLKGCVVKASLKPIHQ